MLRISILLFALSSLCSCKVDKSVQKEKPVSQISIYHSDKLEDDHDPYFVESEADFQKTGPKSISRNLIQDRKGNYWFATWEGIIQYDGTTFTNHTNKDNLRRWHAFAVLEDSKGNIWFGTVGGGVYLYNGKDFINITEKEGLVGDRTTCLYEDTMGRIWFGAEKGATCHNPKIALIPNEESMKNYTFEDGLASHDINDIIQDDTGKFWFGTRGEASFFDGEKFSIIKNNLGEPFTNVRSIVKDKNGNMWLGGNDGLWLFNNGLFIPYADNFVGYIQEDSKGNIYTSSCPHGSRDWVLQRYNTSNLFDPSIKPDLIREQQGQLFGILIDNKQQIWFGNEYGICSYDGITFNEYR